MATAALKQGPASAGDLAVLDRLNAAYVQSVDRADVRWFEENLTADFLNTNPDGSLIDRAQFLAQIGRGSTVADIRPEDVRIRLMGDFAVIHARTVYRKSDGQPGAGRYTDIWARRDGRWLCVAAHVSRA
jgi:ketosteroid isomerase-like protein